MKTFRLAAAAAASVLFLTGCSLWGAGSESEAAGSSYSSVWDRSSEQPQAPKLEKKDFKLSTATEYFYDRLSSQRMKTAVLTLIKGLRAHDEAISLEGLELKEDELREIFDLVISCEPELGWLDYHYHYEVETYKSGKIANAYFRYTLSLEEERAAVEEMDSIIEKIVSATEGMSDFDRMLYFHDHIISNCEYDESGKNAWSAYGCLVEGRAVCEGYSKALIALCSAAGVACLPVNGTIDKEGQELHMWNKVRMDNEWYNIDLSWDDPVNADDNESSELGSYINHVYFGCNDERMSLDHIEEEISIISYPKANAAEDNYFIKSGLYIDDEERAGELLYSIAADRLERGESAFQILFSSDEVYSSFYENQIKSEQIFTALSQLANEGFNVDGTSFLYLMNDEQDIITFILKQN